MKLQALTATLILLGTAAAGCTTARKVLAVNPTPPDVKPISNPFAGYQAGLGGAPTENMIFRTRKGDRAVEVEIPQTSHGTSDFVIPVNPNVASDRSPASASGGFAGDTATVPVDTMAANPYKDREPTVSDREILKTFPPGMPEDENRRREIEQELGLVRADEMTPEKQKSYLASIDQVKQLYGQGRYEAGLLEVDQLIREYPTSPRLHEMRGTLLDRLGHVDLALKSWKQALRFDPKNQSLRRFIERKEQKRGLASP